MISDDYTDKYFSKNNVKSDKIVLKNLKRFLAEAENEPNPIAREKLKKVMQEVIN